VKARSLPYSRWGGAATSWNFQFFFFPVSIHLPIPPLKDLRVAPGFRSSIRLSSDLESVFNAKSLSSSPSTPTPFRSKVSASLNCGSVVAYFAFLDHRYRIYYGCFVAPMHPECSSSFTYTLSSKRSGCSFLFFKCLQHGIRIHPIVIKVLQASIRQANPCRIIGPRNANPLSGRIIEHVVVAAMRFDHLIQFLVLLQQFLQIGGILIDPSLSGRITLSAIAFGSTGIFNVPSIFDNIRL